ncbi:uncharacterized protein tmem79a isoform X2 [Misgurnus anguillicaudatus]|uniref:uncharacterized protein tmem79a isoform X2 n=1 Tax=Misgurnus anguillicaudatus TaxID=75329 RepID=UPI00243513F7|nr:uncharacterized protein tmem79a isoform X2 [Misgurnus anguillicaudatus]
MTDALVFRPESPEENLTEPQRSDGDELESGSLRWFEIQSTERGSPEGRTSSQEQMNQPERSSELKGQENWIDMQDKKKDDNDDDEDDDDESEDQLKEGDGSLADDEDDGCDDDLQETWTSEKARLVFTPTVMILKPTSNQEDLNESNMIQMEKVPLHNLHMNQSEHFHPQWIDEIDKPKGVLVQGVSRLKFGTLKPLFDGILRNREVGVHSYYVRESLHLYLLYFMQLAVMATYAQQEVLKLVPMLTIIFVFGRLIYWVCAVFGSSVRAFGFGLSFLPLLPLLGANIYFICSAEGQEVMFDVAPPTTAPPPKQRWWG